MTQEERGCDNCSKIFDSPEKGQMKICDECGNKVVVGKGVYNPNPSSLAHTRRTGMKDVDMYGRIRFIHE